MCAAQRMVGFIHFMHHLAFCTNLAYFRSVYCIRSPCQLVSLTPNCPASQKSFVVVFGSGEVYTWGDNDEGQLGDGTTNAIQRPRLVAALQGKKINRVACGSAHTLAWSTSKPTNAGKLPSQVLNCQSLYVNYLSHVPVDGSKALQTQASLNQINV